MKLFITDYDGTFYIDEESLKLNKQRIEKLKKLGFKVIISTGRSFSSIKNQVSLNNIYYDYLHCADGAAVFDKDDNLLNFYEIKHYIVEKLMNLAQQINYEEIQIGYPKSYEATYKENDKISGINIVIHHDNLKDEFITKFLNLKKEFLDYNFLVYDHGTYIYLCVKAKDVNKAKAIKFMQDKFNIKDSDIYVIGDSDNDYEMIKGYHGVSIYNNYDNVKEVSKKQYHYVYEYIDEILSDA